MSGDRGRRGVDENYSLLPDVSDYFHSALLRSTDYLKQGTGTNRRTILA